MNDKKSGTLVVIKYILISIFAFIVAMPYIWMIISSFKSGNEVFNKNILFPTVWHFENYPNAMKMAPFGTFFKNSFILAFIAMGAQIVTCSLAAFGFAKINFKLKNVLFMIFLSSMMIPSEATIVSNFLMINTLGLMNTYLGISIVSMTSVFGIFLLRQFFLGIPDSLTEAAHIDGCNDLYIFLRIFLPLSKGAIATIAIFAFINSWNSFMWPLTVTNDTAMRTVQVGIRYMVDPDLGTKWPELMAASTVIVLPMLVLFIFLQKYFVEGISKTGIK